MFKQLALPIELEMGGIGWANWQRTGDAVSEKTWQQIAQIDAILLGWLNSLNKNQTEIGLPIEMQGQGIQYRSPIIQLQQRLGIFAKVQPVQHLLGKHTPFRCCVISGTCNNLEEASFNTRHHLTQLFQYAFDYADKEGYSRLTFADNPALLHAGEHAVGYI